MPIMRLIFAALVLPILAVPLKAEQITHVFSLSVAGIKAGTLQTTTTHNGKAFSTSGVLNPSRLLKTLRDVGYAGQSAGTHWDGTYAPRRYSGQTRTGSRNTQVKMRFNQETPSVDAYLPERETRAYDVDPSNQRGTVDPLTAATMVFNDQPAASLCNRVIPMFDGRRATKVSFAAPQINGDTATCAGTYTRVAGFSAEDMQERVNFPFTLLYTRINEDTFRLMSFTTKTNFGSARAKRK